MHILIVESLLLSFSSHIPKQSPLMSLCVYDPVTRIFLGYLIVACFPASSNCLEQWSQPVTSEPWKGVVTYDTLGTETYLLYPTLGRSTLERLQASQDTACPLLPLAFTSKSQSWPLFVSVAQHRAKPAVGVLHVIESLSFYFC